MKHCPRCKLDLPATAFNKGQGWCKACFKTYVRAWAAGKVAAAATAAGRAPSKRCSICGEDRPAASFFVDNGRPDKRTPFCKRCVRPQDDLYVQLRSRRNARWWASNRGKDAKEPSNAEQLPQDDDSRTGGP